MCAQVLLSEMDKVAQSYVRHGSDIDVKLVAIMEDVWRRSEPVRLLLQSFCDCLYELTCCVIGHAMVQRRGHRRMQGAGHVIQQAAQGAQGHHAALFPQGDDTF